MKTRTVNRSHRSYRWASTICRQPAPRLSWSREGGDVRIADVRGDDEMTLCRLPAGRRARARGLALALALLASPAFAGPGNSDDDKCPNGRDTVFVNGVIYTMDAQNRVVSTVTMHNDKFSAVGNDAGLVDNRCKQVINLNGRTVVPGLVDNHNHIILLGLRPGYHT